MGLPIHNSSSIILLQMDRTYESQPHIRVLGADATGKTELCKAIVDLRPEFVRFSETDSYVYDWLRTHKIGRSSYVKRDQLRHREQIFYAYNRVQAMSVREVTWGKKTHARPVVAVRGRADTIITHGVKMGRRTCRDMGRLFPTPHMRPDVLVVLTTNIEAIGRRLDQKNERKTGLNSLEFHARCQDEYLALSKIASKKFPVLVFDTSKPRNTPESIAHQVLEATVSV